MGRETAEENECLSGMEMKEEEEEEKEEVGGERGSVDCSRKVGGKLRGELGSWMWRWRLGRR